MIVEQQDTLAGPSQPFPGFDTRAERFGKRLSPEPTRFVPSKSAFELAERQQEAPLAGLRLAAAERFGRLERGKRLGEPAERA
jgi:hypothetical protein